VRALDEEAAKDWLGAVARGEVRARAPGFVSLEVGNALAKYVRAGSLTPEEADDELRAVLHAPISLIPTGLVARQALALAVTRGLSVYDAAYLALALGSDAILVTADRRLAAEADRSALLPDEGPPG
jgi:predicted nucleic acid-binding protein